MRRVPLVDELLVIDSDSTDGTAEVARAAGADVVATADVLPAHGTRPGKGEALWKSLAATTGDLVVFLDADLLGDVAHFVPGLLGPLLTDPQIAYVKGCYTRPLELDGAPQPAGGGRVTELTARPLLNALWPELAGVVQPLGGEYAGRRSALEQVPFVSGYGVEVGLLIDLLAARRPRLARPGRPRRPPAHLAERGGARRDGRAGGVRRCSPAPPGSSTPAACSPGSGTTATGFVPRSSRGRRRRAAADGRASPSTARCGPGWWADQAALVRPDVAVCRGGGPARGRQERRAGSPRAARFPRCSPLTGPEVVAHRGASAEAPEHTMAAYRRAADMGADAVECDVRMTRDGVLVCVHDRQIATTSNGRGVVSALHLDELEQFHFGARKSTRRSRWADDEINAVNDEPDVENGLVLTLERLLDYITASPGTVRLAIETKHPTRHARKVEEALVASLERFGLLGDGRRSSGPGGPPSG